jgi:hypothetical protein
MVFLMHSSSLERLRAFLVFTAFMLAAACSDSAPADDAAHKPRPHAADALAAGVVTAANGGAGRHPGPLGHEGHMPLVPVPWQEQQQLLASDGIEEDRFGFAVALDGDLAVVTAVDGDPFDDDPIAGAYVFLRRGGSFIEQQKLEITTPAFLPFFGSSVSLGDDTMLVGASGDFGNELSTGAVYAFAASAGRFGEGTQLVASDGTSNDSFGNSVSMSGNKALIGAYGDAEFTCADYVFVRSGGT